MSHLYFRRYLEAGSGGRTMVRVRLFGGAEVEGDGLPIGGAAARRKSLAVLGLLGASGDRGLERAVALYAGPFLDGFYLAGASEFEHWVESERTGLAQRLVEALETLAAKAAAGGDRRQAAWWWQRLADREPLSSRITVHLMSALAAAGNRAEALERARSYQELLARELEAAPNPAVVALANQLRREPAALIGAGVRGVLPGSNAHP